MKILVLPGDGIGEEITNATMTILRAVDKVTPLELDYDVEEIGFASLKRSGSTFPDAVFEKARTSDGIILGPVQNLDYPPPDQGGVNASSAIRVKLDLYANVRPARTRPNLPSKAEHMDLVIMREGTEGFYPDRNMYDGTGEFMPDENMALSVRKITAHASNRIARRAFELAAQRRKKVTAIHKANCFKLTDGLFLREVRKVAEEFPDVELEEMIVDASAAILVRDSARFDVICTTNFHGDILSDLVSELSGGLGLGASINAGDELCCAQAQHGTAPDIAGQNKANPTSLILSTAMLLDWLGTHKNRPVLNDAAKRIDTAIDATLGDPASRTADLGGTLSTQAFTEKVAEKLSAGASKAS